MTEQAQVTRTVSATVKGKEQLQDGWKVSLEIPAFNSQYPTTLNRLPEQVAAQFVPGGAVNVVLGRERLRQDKDGSQPWHFWWGFLRFAVPGAETAQATKEASTAVASEASRGESIERQVALKEARAGVEFLIGPKPEGHRGVTEEDIREYTKRLGQLYRGMVKLLRDGAARKTAPPPVQEEPPPEPIDPGDIPF